MSKEQYGQNLGENLRDLNARIRAKRYRHQAIRRVHIPKERGKTRPIGVSTIEDKIVQNALREVLEVIYEPVFHDSSYGFRPRRGAHDALRSLNRMIFEREVNWVIEADIQSYFDSIDRTKLKEMLRQRIADESMMRLIGKCLHVGILDGLLDEPLNAGRERVVGVVDEDVARAHWGEDVGLLVAVAGTWAKCGMG